MTQTLHFGHDCHIHPIQASQKIMSGIRPFLEFIWRAETPVQFERLVRAAVGKYPAVAEMFHIDLKRPSKDFRLKDEYLYLEENPILLTYFLARSGGRKVFNIAKYGDSLLDGLQTMLLECGGGRCTLEELKFKLGPSLGDTPDALLENGFLSLKPPAHPQPRFAEDYGVYRLQHAGLLLRTPEAGVIADPHFHSKYEPPGLRTVRREDLEGKVDCILISHNHGDHFNWPSLLMFPLDTPIIVPRVPRATLICEDMVNLLRKLGFTRIYAPRWYDPPFRVGDLEVHVLPFYGEQPMLREGHRDPELRNWGNTYFIRSPAYNAFIAIDSGSDVHGSMQEVATHVRQQFGPVDFLFSNLREFNIFHPTYILGDGRYWLTLTSEQMAHFDRYKQDCITLGPRGVADLCNIMEVRHFMPYAHWWANLGENGGVEEERLVAKLERELTPGCATQILNWNIGDGIAVKGKRRYQRLPVCA